MPIIIPSPINYFFKKIIYNLAKNRNLFRAKQRIALALQKTKTSLNLFFSLFTALKECKIHYAYNRPYARRKAKKTSDYQCEKKNSFYHAAPLNYRCYARNYNILGYTCQVEPRRFS